MDREVVDRLQELAVVAPLVPTPGARRPEHLQRHVPVLIAHPRQHGRPPTPTRYEPKAGEANQHSVSLTTPPAMPESIRPHRLVLSDGLEAVEAAVAEALATAAIVIMLRSLKMYGMTTALLDRLNHCHNPETGNDICGRP